MILSDLQKQSYFDLLLDEFKKDKIHFAIIFGSLATGSEHIGSDIDIAIFGG